MRELNKLLFIFIFSTFSFGCSLANYVVDPYSTLHFEIADNANPDINGRASPVVVIVYELSSRTLFDSQDFFELYDNYEQVLGPDLINSTELELEPGSDFDYDLPLKPGVRYAGVLVAYRNIDDASWRQVIAIDPTDYNTFDIHIGELSVFVK